MEFLIQWEYQDWISSECELGWSGSICPSEETKHGQRVKMLYLRELVDKGSWWSYQDFNSGRQWGKLPVLWQVLCCRCWVRTWFFPKKCMAGQGEVKVWVIPHMVEDELLWWLLCRMSGWMIKMVFSGVKCWDPSDQQNIAELGFVHLQFRQPKLN